MKKILSMMFAVTLAVLLCAGCSKEQFAAKTFEGEARAVVLDLENTAVEVVPSEDGQVRVAYYESEKRGLSIVLDGGTLTVTSDGAGASLGVLPEVSYRTVKVYLPAGLASISLTTTGESVALSDISAGEVALDVNGGDVSFERLAVGVSLGVTVKNGNIAGSLLGGWDDFAVSCTVKKGESNLPERKEGGEKSLSVDCNNGDVDIELLPQ